MNILQPVNDLAIVCFHFNWCKFRIPNRNLFRFLRQMESAGIPVYGVELSTDDSFDTVDFPNWGQLKVPKESVCFQKEACINWVVKNKVPEKYKKIAWVDHDLLFMNPKWYIHTSKKLDKYKLVQMFSSYRFTDINGKSIIAVPSLIKSATVDKAIARRVGVPGCAWAARREFWDECGLYSYCFLGGGDTMLIYTILDAFSTEKLKNVVGPPWMLTFGPYLEWKNKIRSYVCMKEISYTEGEIVHEWHGEHKDRKYESRYEILNGINYNTLLDNNGLVQIRSDTAHELIMNYFKNRNEDGIDILT